MSHPHRTPTQRLLQMISEERSELYVLLIYALVVILLTLAVPLAMQSLVNTVAVGLFPQPIVVLSLLVLSGLAIAGVLQVTQMAVAESIQLRVFSNTAFRLADRLIRVRLSSLRGEYAPELVNRFFDVLTIQKSLSKLLVDVFTAAVQTLVGLLVLGFYSPTLLAVDFLILLFFVAGTILLGTGGLRTSIDESYEKYRVAEWLEEIARCHVSFKLYGNREFLTRRIDRSVVAYLNARRDHFRITIRQLGGYFLFAAIANAGGLAAGGWQVLSGRMTLGQLVAAQLIVNLILAGMDKVVRNSGDFFDLLTGLEKVGHLTDLESERTGGRLLPEKDRNSGSSLICRNVQFRYAAEEPVLTGLDLNLAPGERVSLVGASGAGKSTLASLICGLEEPSFGSIEIDGVDVREADLASLRSVVGMVGYEREVIAGTIEENITLGRERVTPEDVRWAIEMVELTDDIVRMREGLRTQVVSGGLNLSQGQIQRILIARAIVDRPRILILDEAFTGVDQRIASRALDRIFDPNNHWTIIDISHEPEIVTRTEVVHVLAGGKISETGSPEELAKQPDCEFSQLFPYLCYSLREGRPVLGKERIL